MIYEGRYNSSADILEFFFGMTIKGRCRLEELIDGIIVKREIKSGIIRKITIFDFKKRKLNLKKIFTKLGLNTDGLIVIQS